MVQDVLYLHHPSVTVDCCQLLPIYIYIYIYIFTINFAFNCCWDSYRKWIVAHRIHRFPHSISGHSIFVVNSHNRVPTSLFAIATMRRNFVTNFHSASCPPLSWGGTMSTTPSWSQVDALLASYRNSPRSSESTSCHGIRQFLLWWQYDCGLRLQADPSQGWSLQSDPTRSSFFWRTCRGWIGRGCCHISFCDTSFEVDLPCGTLCNQVLSRTCDHVVGLFWCRSSGWRTNPARMRCTSCFLWYHLS